MIKLLCSQSEGPVNNLPHIRLIVSNFSPEWFLEIFWFFLYENRVSSKYKSNGVQFVCERPCSLDFLCQKGPESAQNEVFQVYEKSMKYFLFFMKLWQHKVLNLFVLEVLGQKGAKVCPKWGFSGFMKNWH